MTLSVPEQASERADRATSNAGTTSGLAAPVPSPGSLSRASSGYLRLQLLYIGENEAIDGLRSDKRLDVNIDAPFIAVQ
jgi:hypothetical protein